MGWIYEGKQFALLLVEDEPRHRVDLHAVIKGEWSAFLILKNDTNQVKPEVFGQNLKMLIDRWFNVLDADSSLTPLIKAYLRSRNTNDPMPWNALNSAIKKHSKI